jgi:hypothetical protein
MSTQSIAKQIARKMTGQGPETISDCTSLDQQLRADVVLQSQSKKENFLHPGVAMKYLAQGTFGTDLECLPQETCKNLADCVYEICEAGGIEIGLAAFVNCYEPIPIAAIPTPDCSKPIKVHADKILHPVVNAEDLAVERSGSTIEATSDEL